MPWAQVATFASAGVSSGAAYDFGFFQDLNVWYDGTKNWGNDITTMRVDTRLAARSSPPARSDQGPRDPVARSVLATRSPMPSIIGRQRQLGPER